MVEVEVEVKADDEEEIMTVEATTTPTPRRQPIIGNGKRTRWSSLNYLSIKVIRQVKRGELQICLW